MGNDKYHRCMYCLGEGELIPRSEKDYVITPAYVICKCGCEGKTSVETALALGRLVRDFGTKSSALRIKNLVGIAISHGGLTETYNGIENVPINGDRISNSVSVTEIDPTEVFTLEAIEEVGLRRAKSFIDSEIRRLSYMLNPMLTPESKIPFWVVSSMLATAYLKIVDGSEE